MCTNHTYFSLFNFFYKLNREYQLLGLAYRFPIKIDMPYIPIYESPINFEKKLKTDFSISISTPLHAHTINTLKLLLKMSTTTETVSAYDELLAQALALEPAERYALTLALLDSLSAAVGVKKGKGKGKGTPRGPTAWTTACKAVGDAIKGCDGYKTTHRMNCASYLKEHCADVYESLDAEAIVEAYQSPAFHAWLASKEQAKAAEDGKSTASSKASSKASKASKASKPSAAEAKKAKAEAEKAAKAAEAEAKKAAAKASEPLELEEEVKLVVWKHDFGEGKRTYQIYEAGDHTYVYESDGVTFVGERVKEGRKYALKTEGVTDPLAE